MEAKKNTFAILDYVLFGITLSISLSIGLYNAIHTVIMVYNDKQFLMSLFSTPSIVKLFLGWVAFTNNKTVDI
jgi:hypothetical protein